MYCKHCFLTAGRLLAAMHKVVVMDTGSDDGTDTTQPARLSLCLKLHADSTAVLAPAVLAADNAGSIS